MSTLPADGIFIGMGVGVGMLLLLLVLSTAVVLIVVVVLMKGKAAHKQKRKMKIRGNLHNKALNCTEAGNGSKNGMTCVSADYIDADGCGKADDDKNALYTQKQDAKKPHCNTSLRKAGGKQSHGGEYEDGDMGEETSSIIDGFSPHEDVECGAKIEPVNVQGPQGSSTPASATKAPPMYAVVDKYKKMGAQWKEDNGYTVAFIHQCTIPVMGEMSDSCWKGVVASGGVEEREQYEDTVGIRYEALENQRRTWNLGSEC